MDPLSAPGVAVDAEALLALRHTVRNGGERRLLPTGRPGGFLTRQRGRGLETVDSRVFVDGDDIRHLDRNTTARSGVMHVRTFHDEREKTALLIADFRPSMLWGTRRAFRSVAAAEILAIVGWRVIQAGGRAGLIAFGPGNPVFVPPQARERGMAAVIGGLAAAHRAALVEAAASRGTTEPKLERVIGMAGALVANQASVILATALDEPGEGFDAAAAALAGRTALTVLLIRDGFESEPPRGSYPYATGSGPIGWATIRDKAAPRLDPRVARLQARGIEAIPIDTGGGIADMTRQLDRADERRR